VKPCETHACTCSVQREGALLSGGGRRVHLSSGVAVVPGIARGGAMGVVLLAGVVGLYMLFPVDP
jgi:hypothetical protein